MPPLSAVGISGLQAGEDVKACGEDSSGLGRKGRGETGLGQAGIQRKATSV